MVIPKALRACREAPGAKARGFAAAFMIGFSPYRPAKGRRAGINGGFSRSPRMKAHATETVLRNRAAVAAALGANWPARRSLREEDTLHDRREYPDRPAGARQNGSSERSFANRFRSDPAKRTQRHDAR